MKKLIIAAAAAATIGISIAAEILPQCSPWQSQGLNQVKLEIGSEKLTLAENGKAAVCIVIPPSGENIQYYQAAAETIKKYLELSTGATFSIVRGNLPSGKGIFVGPCSEPEVRQEFDDAQLMPEESFMVKTFGRGIMLLGNDQPNNAGRDPGKLDIRNSCWSKGTFFATVDFLQRMIGCRFYFPGKLGTVTPDYKNKTLTIPCVSYTDKPAFSFRSSSYDHHGFTDDAEAETGSIKERSEWGSIMRLGDVHNQITSHTDNNWNKLFAKSHPEYFALREDGSRMIGDHGAQSVQRCYTSASGLQAQLDEIEKYYKGGRDYTAFASQNVAPDQKYIRWWPNDGFNGCHCEQCMKLTDLQAPFSSRHSRLIWDYISRLAKECKQRWPDKKLLVPAYSTFRVIPDDVVVPDNVEIIPVLPGNGFSLAYLKEPACMTLANNDIARLKKLNSGKVWMWMHYPHRPRISSQLHTPYPAPHIMKDFVKSNQEVFSGFYLNGHKTTVLALDSVMLYLWFQMLWNPDIDVDAVSDEYCELMFGPAAETMKQYYAILAGRWENTRWKIKIDYAKASNFLEALIPQSCYFGETYPRKVRDELEFKLNKAQEATPAGSIYRRRMDWMIAGTKKFFVQGKFYDSGNSVKTTAAALSPVIDGELNDWNSIPVLQLVDNASGQKAKLQTNIKTAFDSANLYVSGEVCTPGAKFNTSGEKQQRDCPLWLKDNIELFICAETRGLAESGYPQNAQFYHFIFDADGSVYDAYKPVDGKEDSKVNIDFSLITRRTQDGFNFEMKIPFKSINSIPPVPGRTWPLNIYRTHFDSDGAKYYAWSPTLGSFHDTSRFGVIEFPPNALWTMELKPLKNGENPFIMPDIPAGVERTISFKDGLMIIKCKASQELQKKFELVFYAKDNVRPDIKNSQKPLILRLEAGMQGKGIFRLRCGSALLRSTEEGLGQFYWTRVPASQEINENVLLQADCNPKKQPVHSVNTAVFAIQAEPGSDFTVTLKKMDIFCDMAKK